MIEKIDVLKVLPAHVTSAYLVKSVAENVNAVYHFFFLISMYYLYYVMFIGSQKNVYQASFMFYIC